MLRTFLRLSLAILAIAAFSGCAIERLTGPRVDVSSTTRDGAALFPERHVPPREDDPQPPLDPGAGSEGIGVAFDTLRAGGENH
jgi:hypothetical protein